MFLFRSVSRVYANQIAGMFCEVQLIREVGIPNQTLDRTKPVPYSLIVKCLLRALLSEKANKDHGYFLAVTFLERIGEGKISGDTDDVLFPVAFNCRTFIPVVGERLRGVVFKVHPHGVFVRCGPVKYGFLSAQKMPNYRYVRGKKPLFVNNDLSRIEDNVVICFMVLSVRWVDKHMDFENEFMVLASLVGDFLGPVSSTYSDELDLLMH